MAEKEKLSETQTPEFKAFEKTLKGIVSLPAEKVAEIKRQTSHAQNKKVKA